MNIISSPTPKVPGWLARIVTVLGGAGLFVVAFLDSSVLSFPFVTDLLFMEFVIRRPARILYYVAAATIGSLAGCIWLYLLAKKGGEAYRRRRGEKPDGRIRRWVARHSFLSVFLPSILPPPAPFKAFVIAEGIAEVPLRTFILGLLAGRGLRYAVEGIFAFEYGQRVESFMMQNKLVTIGASIVSIALIYIVVRSLHSPASSSEP